MRPIRHFFQTGEFETFLENKQISKMRKKHLGDQIVINSYVYMFLTVTNLELNPISYVISGDHFQLFTRPNITGNQVLETNLPGFPIWMFTCYKIPNCY